MTGARAGQEIEPRNQTLFGSAQAVLTVEGNTGTIDIREIIQDSPRSKTLCMYGTSAHGSWEIPLLTMADGPWPAERSPNWASR